MTKSDDHAGSGIDKPDAKSLLEKFSDGVKSILEKKPAPQSQKGPDAVANTIVPPAD